MVRPSEMRLPYIVQPRFWLMHKWKMETSLNR